jgi:arylsulfatase A-like enzyme
MRLSRDRSPCLRRTDGSVSRRRARLVAVLCGALGLGGLAAVPVTAAYADSVGFRDAPGGPRGPFHIVSTRIDNTGPWIGIDVWHAGPRWHGRVTIKVDVAGGPAAEYTASVTHGRRPRATARLASGSAWGCSGRRLTSSPRSSVTRLVLPRHCLGMAPRIRARISVTPRQGREDRQVTRSVVQQRRPNVLVLLTDDMRVDDLQYLPLTHRWLGDAGTTWTNALSPYPLCCPARASIFSGMYSHNHKVFSHVEPYGFHSFDDRSTIATWLHGAGYHTALLGKYLNGYGAQPVHGADGGNSVRYVPPGWDDWQGAIDGGLPAGHPNNGSAYRYYSTTLSRNQDRGLRTLRTYQTDGYAGIEEGVVEEATRSDRPFFSYVAFTAPHNGMPREPDDPVVDLEDGTSRRVASPAVPAQFRGFFDTSIQQAPGAAWLDPTPQDQPEELRGGVDDPPNDSELAAMLEVSRQRAEALHSVDLAVDRVMRVLQRSGELSRTYVIFTSDNGYFLGEEGIRQGKVLPYEPALRVPLLLRGPGVPAGQTRTDPFLSLDIAPTILQMAGVEIPASVDGQGMLPVAVGGDRGWRRPVLVNTGPANVVRDTDEAGEPLDPEDPGAPDQRYLLGVRTERYVYMDRASGFQALFDLQVDPEQYDNLVANLPDGTKLVRPGYQRVADELRAQLRAVRACAGVGCRPTLPADLWTRPGS